jgi:thiosulfate reductase cytochrome b subunit
MNSPEKTPQTSFLSGEAIVGAGVTIASLGVLVLLLGCAQWMRQVHDAATILLASGGVLFVVGVIGALIGRSRKRA